VNKAPIGSVLVLGAFKDQFRHKKYAPRHVNCNWYGKKNMKKQNK
jgi:hypothetical protein